MEYDPPPPDAWNKNLSRIDASTPVGHRTATQGVRAGNRAGTVTLQVKELHIDDKGPGGPLPHKIFLDVEVDVG